MTHFRDELIELIKKHDLMSVSNTPDYAIANVMLSAFHSLNYAIILRDNSKNLTDYSSNCECERWRDGITTCPVHGTTKA